MNGSTIGAITLALASVAGAAHAGVEGVLTINGESATLRHGIGYVFDTEDGFEIVLVLSEAPVPEKELVPVEGAQGITLTIERDGRVRSLRAHHDGLEEGMAWALTNGTPILFEPEELSRERIAGRAHAPDVPAEFLRVTLDGFDVRFDFDLVDLEALSE